MNLSNLAICVPVHLPNATSPRVAYFKRHLASLRAASRHWPVHFFIDGGDTLLAKQMISEANFYHSITRLSESQIGIGLNLFHAREFLFDSIKYDHVFVCESDVLITPDLIPLLGHVLDWSKREKAWPAVATSSVVNYNQDARVVALHLMNWWNYLMPKEAWRMIERGLKEYTTFLQGIPYAQRDPVKIAAWYVDRFGMPNQGHCQDQANHILCYKLGIPVWSLTRNRAIHIGEMGENCNTSNYAAITHGKQNLMPTAQDLMIYDFTKYDIIDAPVVSSSPR